MAERRERFPYIHLPSFKDLKFLWSPRVLLADLTIVTGTLAVWNTTRNSQNNSATPIPVSRSADIPPVFTPTVINGEAKSVAPMPPTEIAALATATATAIAKSIETPAPESTPTKVPVKALTKDTKVISSYNVDIVEVDQNEWIRLYQKAVKEDQNLIPPPVDLGETGTMEEYVLPSGVRGIAIKGLEVGKTYTIIAHTEGTADGISKKDDPKTNYAVVNFTPKTSTSDGRRYSLAFPANAEIKAKFFGPKDKREDFGVGEMAVLAIYTVPDPNSSEQQEFENIVGKGVNMAIGFGGKGGTNKQGVDFTKVFPRDEQGRLVHLNPASSK